MSWNKIRGMEDNKRLRRDWSCLLPDILVDTARCLSLIEDFTAFRGVCTKWRAAGAIKAELFKGLSKVPLLMLSEKDDDTDEREFFSLSKNEVFIRMPVPEAKGQRCMDAGFGWILAISSSSAGVVNLFNPFTSSAKIELPNFTAFPEYEERRGQHECCFIQKGILSANPSLTSNFTVVVVVNCALGFWRNGDKSWTMIDVNYGIVGSLGYYKGKMYAIDDNHEIFSWDPDDPAKARLIVKHWEYPSIRIGEGMPYLVESSDGELLAILRNNIEFSDLGATHFGVMRVDLVKKECKIVNDLGTDAVFLGDNATVALDAADFPGVLKPNCIYFTDDSWRVYMGPEFYDRKHGGGVDMGVYNVGDESIERLDVESFSRVCPPLWVFPSF